jgi:hypothetical protein
LSSVPRFFNTAGPCNPRIHYVLPPERRLPGVRRLIDQEYYFVVHSPRQSGKTTYLRTLAPALTEEGRYAALTVSCETGQAADSDVERGIAALLDVIRQAAENHLPESLRPPEADLRAPAETRLLDLLSRWSKQCPRPIVLLLDEIDALRGAVLLSVLRQLRSGYPDRPHGFPQSVGLVGLRDVRDYRLQVRPDEQSLGTSSPFNIKVEALTLPNFTLEEIRELYAQHTADTGQFFTPDATALACNLTGGHPWLVNALARQAVEVLAPDPATPISADLVEAAKELLIQRRDTHLDSLIDRLREPRIRRVLEPILAGGVLSPDVLDDDIQLAVDLGLVKIKDGNLTVANPIYREVIPRALTNVLEKSIPVSKAAFLDPDGRLRFAALLSSFRDFWCQNAEAFLAQAPYSEAAAQLVFMAFLQKIVNGGGSIDREYAVGSGRVDLCVRWPSPEGLERWAVELKVWRDRRPDPLAGGVEQLSGYLARLGLHHGVLMIFDLRSEAPPLPARCSFQELEHEGRHLTVLRL